MTLWRLLAASLLAASLVVSGPGAALAVTVAGDVEPPRVSEARSWCVADSTGRVLAESDAEETFAPASITKVMTAMVALDAGLPMDTVVEVPELPRDGWEAAQVAGYTAGSTSSLEDLLEVMLVYSANDAAYAIAQEVGGSQAGFADLMNAKAAEIGMAHTTFKNPHGLEEDGHESCARDLVTMGRYALTHYPFIARMVRTHQVTVPVDGVARTFYSTDELMPVYRPLIGIKTGKVEAGTTFLGASRREAMTLYTCVLGCATDWGRFQDTMDLMEWAYGSATPVALADPNRPLGTRPFAHHFGLELDVVADAPVTGLLWPDGTPCSYTRVLLSPDQFAVPSEDVGACLWRQGDRVVGAAGYRTSAALTRSHAWPAWMPDGLVPQTKDGETV